MSEEKDKAERGVLRPDITYQTYEKMSDVFIKDATDNKMSVLEMEYILLRMRMDLDAYKHQLLHMGEHNHDDAPNVKFEGSMYK